MDINLVLEGGGVKGIALVGALKRFEDEPNLYIKGVAGTSAGSVVAALYAAGYTANEMKDILMQTPFTKFLDSPWSKTWSLFKNFGLYRTQALHNWMYDLLAKKGVQTFSQTKRDLVIIASNLTKKEIITFDKIKTPTLVTVAAAVRMSSSIPFFFFAYPLGDDLIVDGGLLSNYPFWAFASSSLPTFGFKLVSGSSNKIPEAPNSLASYISSLVSTMLDAHDKKDMQVTGAERTVHIPTGDVATTNFALSDAEKLALYTSGYFAASQFILDKKPFVTAGVSAAVASTERGTDEKELFEVSAERLRNVDPALMETAFDPVEVRRYLTVDPPAARMVNEDSLINVSGSDQDHIMRRIVSDAPVDANKLELEGQISLDDKINAAAITAQATNETQTAFRVRIRFNGPTVAAGRTVKVSWSARIPYAVGQNKDYWVFPVNQFQKPVPVFVIRATFLKNPVERGLFVGSREELRPVSLVGPTIVENKETGGALYTYEARIDKAEGIYVLRWRFV